jgi:hypothetical protein
MDGIIATAVGLYLLLTAPVVAVAWRRGLPAASIGHVAVCGVLLGWTCLGLIWAWVVALEDRSDRLNVDIDIILR